MTCNRLVLLLCLLPFSFAISNEWSNCSRTCGMGISHRLISCQNTNCTGTQKEFRVCNPKECPDHQVDFRSEQCQKYGKKMIPFINASNPCKLICTSPSQKPIEVGTVTDGTPCSSSGICIEGTCFAVSCNRILGSEEKIDACGRCGSTNGICLQVPCRVTNSTASEHSITLPVRSTGIKIVWPLFCNISGSLPATSGQELAIDGPLIEKITIKINCRESSHTFKCGYFMPLYDRSFIDGENFNRHEHQWIKGNEFTPCSQTCGTGVQRSKINCQNVQTEKIVDISLCDNLSTEHLDIHIRICNMPPCPYQWHVSDWSPCSKSCNGGHRNRNVTCVQTTNKLTYPVSKDPALCSEHKPVSQETCNHHHCYNHWHKGPWSDCSSSCGNGTRTRNITCINGHGMEIEPNNCSLLAKYKNKENCTGEMCTYRWIASNWSNCSVNCGNGTQTRNLSCQHVKENKIVNDSLCPDSFKPPIIKQCEGSYCIGVWRVEKWGPCEAAECHSKGLRNRSYYCVVNASDGLYIDVTKCSKSNEPSGSEICYKTKGCKAHWVALPWGKCSVTCGNGFQTRGLICKLGNMQVNTSKCPIHKPSVVKNCDENVPCPPSCSPAPICNSIQSLYCNNPTSSIEQLCKFSCCNCDCGK